MDLDLLRYHSVWALKHCCQDCVPKLWDRMRVRQKINGAKSGGPPGYTILLAVVLLFVMALYGKPCRNSCSLV